MGVFQKTRIAGPALWNGSVVLKFTTAQPQKIEPLRKDIFPACPLLAGSGSGAFSEQDRIFDAVLLKDPHTEQKPVSLIHVIYLMQH